MRSGTFKIALSARWCAAAKRRQIAEEKRHDREVAEINRGVAQEEAEHARHAREKHKREVERFEINCRAIGGTPVEISTSEGNRIVCHSKTGGVIPVPQ